MLVDLLSRDNYGSYNIKIANVLGLHNAIYIDILISLNNQAQKNGRMDKDKYFELDRDYIQKITTFDLAEQQLIETKLESIGLIKVIGNLIYIGLDTLTNTIASDDEKLLKNIAKVASIKSTAGVIKKMTVREKMAYTLKSKIICPNPKLAQAYCDWIEGVYANPNGFLSAKSIVIFQKTLEDYAKNDLDLLFKLIDIATVAGYRDAGWVINLFEKDYQAEYKKLHASSNSKVMPSSESRKILLDKEAF